MPAGLLGWMQMDSPGTMWLRPVQMIAGILAVLATCSCAALLADANGIEPQTMLELQSVDHSQLQNSGRSPFKAPLRFNLRNVSPQGWEFNVGLKQYRCEPAVNAEGRVFVCLGGEWDYGNPEPMNLLAISGNGGLDWYMPLGKHRRVRVNIDNYGTPYVMHGSKISRLDYSGHVIDSIRLDIFSSNFVLGNYGQMLAASDRYDVRVIDNTGVTRARLDNPGNYDMIEFQDSPDLAGLWLKDPDLHPGLLVSSNGHHLISFREDLYYLNGKGEEIWRQPVPTGKVCGIACQDSMIALTTLDGTVQSLDLNGRLRWLTTLPPKISSRPCIDSAGNVIAANVDGYIISISPVGSCNWITSLDDDSTVPRDNQLSFHYKVLLSADDQVLVTNTDGKLYCLDNAGQLRFRTKFTPLQECYAAFGPEGRIHAFCGSQYVVIGEV